jgi:hypothetical protein
MIQLAWRFLMFQKESVLALLYRARTADSRSGTRKTMIVALARKLVIAPGKFVATGETLEGVILRPPWGCLTISCLLLDDVFDHGEGSRRVPISHLTAQIRKKRTAPSDIGDTSSERTVARLCPQFSSPYRSSADPRLKGTFAAIGDAGANENRDHNEDRSVLDMRATSSSAVERKNFKQRRTPKTGYHSEAALVPPLREVAACRRRDPPKPLP